MNTIRKLIFNLIPDSHVVIGHSKRALLPFIGDIGKGLFGLATQGDLEVLAQHINALTKQSNRVASALAKHGGDLSSYILQLDHRVEQMMIGIKNNHMVTKLINVKLNDESRAIHDKFSTMLSLYPQQLDQSYTVNHHLDKISAAIADLVRGKLSPLIIPPGDITTTLDFVQNHLSVQGFHVVRQSPQYYYKYGSFTVTRGSHSVFISLKFPITFHKDPFKLYKILSFPLPINDTSRDATQIV